MTFILLVTAVTAFNKVLRGELRITSVDELIQFKDNVNNRTNYTGTTVLLDSDIDLTGNTFEPVGSSESNYFLGIFDGQGHVISNLKMNSSSQYVGLFGYSEGLIIKNVILDSSCSITSSFSGFDYSYFGGAIGGIIGKCEAYNGPCTIENSMNTGSVTFSGDISDNYFFFIVGGIAGQLYSSKYSSTLRSCANYGFVTYSGKSRTSNIGGIIGDSCGSSSYRRVYIYNSINLGTITYNGTTLDDISLGGVTGRAYYATIENCVSGGEISSNKTSYIGSIVGELWSFACINYCYLTNDLSDYNKYGYKKPDSESNILNYNKTTFKLSENVSIGSYTGNSLIDALNVYSDYYYLRYYSHWLLNKERKAVSFTINERSSFTMNYQVILLPSLAGEGNKSFDGWYMDIGFTTLLTKHEVANDTLYGRFEENTNNYTIAFETRGGSFAEPIAAPFGSVVTLPSSSIRDHCTIAWWENKYGDKAEFTFIMPAHNITLFAAWKCTRIKTPEDLLDFSNVVNRGLDSFNGSTVFLDSDLTFTEMSFEPIGTSDSEYFLGIFDGQGHVISNLAMTSLSQYVGLFGYSRGLTIKNVIIDSSCSITSAFSSFGYAYMGGIIGQCYAESRPCNIENSVNMGSITFRGSARDNNILYLGGIAGSLSSCKDYIIMKNCANYGDITYRGENRSSYIGGIAGYSGWDYLFKKVYIYNCLNYGRITHNGTTPDSLHLGGIVGRTSYVIIENCMSEGKISIDNSSGAYIGSIIGYVSINTTINYTYYTSDLSGYEKYGQNYSIPREFNTFSYDSTTSKLNGIVSVGDYTGASLIEALNTYGGYYPFNDYSSWLINKNNKTASFTINERTNPIRMDYQVLLLPSLVSEGNKSFLWFTDNEFTRPLTEYEVTSDTKLYGKYCGPNYVVTFNPSGGIVSQSTKEVIFGSVYGELPTPSRMGYLFLGWFNEKNESITKESIVKVPVNHTLHAHWLEISRYVEIFFSTKDMTREEIEKAVKKYTDADFVIVEIESGAEEMRVIVRFVDAEVAEEFVRNVNAELARGEKNLIKRIDFAQEGTGSFSIGCYPMAFLLYLI